MSDTLPICVGAKLIITRSCEDLEAMHAFISKHEIHPLIDRVFEFDEAPTACEYMESGDFMEKIVIWIQ